MPELCLCPEGNPVAYYDTTTEKGYCPPCASSELTSSRSVHIQYLNDILPYEVGEHVYCWTVGKIYDGEGEVIKVSEDLRDGGTPVHPAYLVRLKDGQELWYTSICLRRKKV